MASSASKSGYHRSPFSCAPSGGLVCARFRSRRSLACSLFCWVLEMRSLLWMLRAKVASRRKRCVACTTLCAAFHLASDRLRSFDWYGGCNWCADAASLSAMSLPYLWSSVHLPWATSSSVACPLVHATLMLPGPFFIISPAAAAQTSPSALRPHGFLRRNRPISLVRHSCISWFHFSTAPQLSVRMCWGPGWAAAARTPCASTRVDEGRAAMGTHCAVSPCVERASASA